jgi:hypothetical protein
MFAKSQPWIVCPPSTLLCDSSCMFGTIQRINMTLRRGHIDYYLAMAVAVEKISWGLESYEGFGVEYLGRYVVGSSGSSTTETGMRNGSSPRRMGSMMMAHRRRRSECMSELICIDGYPEAQSNIRISRQTNPSTISIAPEQDSSRRCSSLSKFFHRYLAMRVRLEQTACRVMVSASNTCSINRCRTRGA